MNGRGQGEIVLGRAVMMLLGGAAGVALWIFADVLVDRLEDLRQLLFSAALVMGGFAILLALNGPLRLAQALIGALIVALPAALLLLWASYRFDEIERFLAAGHEVLAYGAILFVGTPYAAAALQHPGGWRDYARLFDTSWSIVVRYAAAWLFVGLFWAVLMLSDQLLQLVGLDFIDQFIRLDPVPYVLSGLVLGLALAVIWEMREYISPYLIHRLLRLLLPMLLPVVAVFLLALPLRGLSGLFGSFSAAATLMGVALAGITLISTALDRADEDAAQGRAMVWSAKVYSLAVPVLAGLAIYAVWLRVEQYGWTPLRLIAAFAGVFLLAYGLAYAVSVLRGGDGWMGRIRGANRWMALGLVAMSALWLTPVVNAERISAQSQLARARAGLDTPEKMALWEMAQEWGGPGRQALGDLEAAADGAGAADVMAAIARARQAKSRYAYRRQAGEGDLAPRVAELERLLQIRPDSVRLPKGALDGLSAQLLDSWLAGCRNRLADGRPGCAVILGDFRPGLDAVNGYLLLNTQARYVQVSGIAVQNGRVEPFGTARGVGSLASARQVSAGLTAADLAEVLDGKFEIVPVGLNALKIGAREIIPDN